MRTLAINVLAFAGFPKSYRFKEFTAGGHHGENPFDVPGRSCHHTIECPGPPRYVFLGGSSGWRGELGFSFGFWFSSPLRVRWSVVLCPEEREKEGHLNPTRRREGSRDTVSNLQETSSFKDGVQVAPPTPLAPPTNLY